VISDYSTLQTAIAAWLNKAGDANLTANIPTFIQLAEARFRRKLDDMDQIITGTITVTNGEGTLPADFGGLMALEGAFTEAVDYALISGQIITTPQVTGDVTILYKQSLPALSNSVTTNWLLNRAPDAYLFGSLIQAEFYGWNDERLPLMKAALDEMIDELIKDSEARRWSRDGLAPMIRRGTGIVYPPSTSGDDPGDLAGIIG
jgi:hypothetical protein